MEQYTDRMVELLGAVRRERNGAVADSMRFVGKSYGLNYGVSLPTVRLLAYECGCDDGFAHYLYLQEVRELHLAALHIADPTKLLAADVDFWARGIYNSEVAEEAAFALLSRTAALPEIFKGKIADSNPLFRYALLLAGARFINPHREWALAAVEAVAAVDRDANVTLAEARMVARGAVALCVAVGAQNEENRLAVLHAADSLENLPAAEYLREELSWQLSTL